MTRARRPLLRWITTGAALALLSLWFAAGCSNLIGLDEFSEVDDEGGGEGCDDPGDDCESSSDCCGDATCVDLADGSVCAAECVYNSECSSGCCHPLEGGGGACAPGSYCGGDGCRTLGSSCDDTADCCTDEGEPVCANFDSDSPSICAAWCSDDTDCGSGCCVDLDAENGACGPAEYCD